MSRLSNTDGPGGSPSNRLSQSTATCQPRLRGLRRGRPRFELRTYDGSSGSRDYRIYIPGTPPLGARSLLVMLHGCTQNAHEFALATGMNAQAEKHGMILVYPEQTTSHHAKACWNWYRPRDQRRGSGEATILAELTQGLAAEFGIEPDRVFVAGISAGGAMAAILGEAYPDVYAAVGVHSGVACGLAVDLFSALSAMRGHVGWLNLLQRVSPDQRPMRTIVFHGTADSTVHPRNAKRIIAAAGPGIDTRVREETGTSRGGRAYTVTIATAPDGSTQSELWMIEGSEHAWSGGWTDDPYTDPAGPDASAEMVRFFLQGSRQSSGQRDHGPVDALRGAEVM